MRVLQGLLYATTLALAVGIHDVSASTASEKTTLSKLGGKESNPAESRLLRQHDPEKEDEKDDEERGFEWLMKLLKLDDLPPQKAVELTNMQKLDDIVDTKKLDDVIDLKKLNPKKADDELEKMYDDFKYLLDDIMPEYKRKGVTMEQIRNEIVEAAKDKKKLEGLKQLDAKKADDELEKMYNDLKFMVDDIVPDLKAKKLTDAQIIDELVGAGVTDKKKIENVLNWVRDS